MSAIKRMCRRRNGLPPERRNGIRRIKKGTFFCLKCGIEMGLQTLVDGGTGLLPVAKVFVCSKCGATKTIFCRRQLV